MEYSEELEVVCQQELERICQKKMLDIKIPKVKLSDEIREDGRLGDHNDGDNTIVVYYRLHTSEEKIRETIRHEARHVWQRFNRSDVYDWWMKKHHDIYILIYSNPKLVEKFGFSCIVEYDAERYSKNCSDLPLPRSNKSLETLVPNLDIFVPRIVKYVDEEIGFKNLTKTGQSAYALLVNKYIGHI